MPMLFVTRIPQLLEDRNMLVKDLYELMAKSDDTYLSYQSLIKVSSRTQPIISNSTNLETMHKIATALGVKIDDLYSAQNIDIKG